MTNLYELSIFSLNFDLRRHLNRKKLFATFRNFNVLLLKVLHLITPIRFDFDTFHMHRPRISFIFDRFNLELLSLRFLICKLIFTESLVK